MTPSFRPSNPFRKPRSRRRHAPVSLALALVLAVTFSCGRSANSAPDAEFIVAAGDSTYWVVSGSSGIKLRGSPMVLARLESKFRELYVVDDDRSYENAEFVGQRLFERDIMTGDSTEIFSDTLVLSLADKYSKQHPDARRLGPEEDPGEEPATSATAEVSVLGVHGPFLSIEYHVDTSGIGDDTWHMTTHKVIDLRSGKVATLADVLGPSEAVTILDRARKLYTETVDSIRRDRRPAARRAAQSITHFKFDPTSFSLAAPNGTLMVAFSAPGQGNGGEGFVLPMRPMAVTEPSWWAEARNAVPSSTREREETWSRGAYSVKAQYDTSARPVRLVLVDSAGKEFPVGGVSAPVHRIYWLDRPNIDRATRTALSKAFDEAALYDEQARSALDSRAAAVVVASRR